MGFEKSKKKKVSTRRWGMFLNGIISSVGAEAAVIVGCELIFLKAFRDGNMAR